MNQADDQGKLSGRPDFQLAYGFQQRDYAID